MSRKSLRRLLVGFGFAVLGNGLAILIFGTMPESGVFYHGAKRYIYGSIWVSAGLAMLIKGSFIKVVSSLEKVVACPKCGTPYNQQEITDQICPICQVELEDLKGFYDRHPDLR
ncbi:MAG TPA: hypothetical protein ENI68_00440 [Gammaproteobacteria bacterium]|nr:hypothetical protein [Gammaproteobacteria bacterium]